MSSGHSIILESESPQNLNLTAPLKEYKNYKRTMLHNDRKRGRRRKLPKRGGDEDEEVQINYKLSLKISKG